jgi:PelA/Pel-15E family pectate lyase
MYIYGYDFMDKFAITLLLTLAVSAVRGQTVNKKYKLDTHVFASNAGHWYGIKDKHNIINPKRKQPRYAANDVVAIGDNILLFQKNNGGWAKNYDVTAVLTHDQQDSIRNDKGNLNTTFDNGTTYTHVASLADVYRVTGQQKYADGAVRGIQFILSAQYGNGGWPQYFPLENNYSRHITYNDDAYVGIMQLLQDVKDHREKFPFVTDDFYGRVVQSFNKGIDCIINTQINDFGEVTAWCQQHDEVTLQPAWARAFEPPSICNAESANIVLLLMSIDHPSAEVKRAIKNAVNWFKDSAVEGIRVKTIAAPPDTSQYTVSKTDRVVVQDPSAPPIWSRYYELQTHRPMFCNRDSKVVYSLTEVARERRSGYAWYTYNPQKVLDKYPAWAQKWLTNN